MIKPKKPITHTHTRRATHAQVRLTSYSSVNSFYVKQKAISVSFYWKVMFISHLQFNGNTNAREVRE